MFMNEYELKAYYEMKRKQMEREAEIERLLMKNSSKKFVLSKMFHWFKKEQKENKICCA